MRQSNTGVPQSHKWLNAFHSMGIDRLSLICSHVFLFKRSVIHFIMLNLQYYMRKNIARKCI
nr:MAG TPA: hypothetical protein [Caudoviricetes sp.]